MGCELGFGNVVGEWGKRGWRMGRWEWEMRFLSMGGVWNTYGAGVKMECWKNCKIAPVKIATAGNSDGRKNANVKKPIFFTFTLAIFGYYKYRFSMNSNSAVQNISKMFLSSRKIYIVVRIPKNIGVTIWKRCHIQDQKTAAGSGI